MMWVLVEVERWGLARGRRVGEGVGCIIGRLELG